MKSEHLELKKLSLRTNELLKEPVGSLQYPSTSSGTKMCQDYKIDTKEADCKENKIGIQVSVGQDISQLLMGRLERNDPIHSKVT